MPRPKGSSEQRRRAWSRNWTGNARPGSVPRLRLVGVVLTVPLFSVWLLVYDRQSQPSRRPARSLPVGAARSSSPVPVLVIPYRATATETVMQNGQSVTRTNDVIRELTLAPEAAELSTILRPEVRKRSIYEAVVYDAAVSGKCALHFPPDAAAPGRSLRRWTSAGRNFGSPSPTRKGLARTRASLGRHAAEDASRCRSSGRRGFFAWVDASSLQRQPLTVDFAYDFRGNASLSLAPLAGDTRWSVKSSWPSPSFGGDFLPERARDRSQRLLRLSTGSAISLLAVRSSARPRPLAQPQDGP